MSSISLSLTVRDPGLIDAYQQQLRQAPRQTTNIVKQTVARVGAKALGRYRQAGSPVTYPISWQSERQRRAFFASNGFNHGIPYQRTGALENGWRLVVTATSDSIPTVELSNPVAYRKFVVGRYQQNMFKGRWYVQSTVTRIVRRELADEVESALIRNVIAIDEAALVYGGNDR